jgi:glucose repression regulatory protein TUP1
MTFDTHLSFKVSSQIHELTHIRQSLLELENKHHQVKMQHEEEIKRLRAELHAARQGNVGGPAIPSSTIGPASLGSGSLPSVSNSNPPYANDPYYARADRDRDRPPERDRDLQTRDRDQRGDRMDREPMRDRPGVDQRDPKRLKTERMKPDRSGMFLTSTRGFVMANRIDFSFQNRLWGRV